MSHLHLCLASACVHLDQGVREDTHDGYLFFSTYSNNNVPLEAFLEHLNLISTGVDHGVIFGLVGLSAVVLSRGTPHYTVRLGFRWRRDIRRLGSALRILRPSAGLEVGVRGQPRGCVIVVHD